MENNNPPQQLNIELGEDMADGTYCNLAVITHSNSEFVLDFINVMPNVPKAKVKSRIIFTPEHAKRFMRALQDNIKRFEQQNGTIHVKDDNGMPPFPPMGGFGRPPGQA